MAELVVFVIWAAIALRTIWVLGYLLCKFIKWLVVRKIIGIPAPEYVTREKVVEKARRTRLTQEERARRIFALYPVPWVPRGPWPTSYQNRKR